MLGSNWLESHSWKANYDIEPCLSLPNVAKLHVRDLAEVEAFAFTAQLTIIPLGLGGWEE